MAKGAFRLALQVLQVLHIVRLHFGKHHGLGRASVVQALVHNIITVPHRQGYRSVAAHHVRIA